MPRAAKPVAQNENTQITAAEAACEILAAEKITMDILRESVRRLNAGEQLPASLTAKVIGQVVYGCQLALAAGALSSRSQAHAAAFWRARKSRRTTAI